MNMFCRNLRSLRMMKKLKVCWNPAEYSWGRCGSGTRYCRDDGAPLSIPTVSLVLGGGHSIGVPMAVSADYSFVVPSATMVIHPVRSSGMCIRRIAPDIQEYGKDPGSDRHIYLRTFQGIPAASGRTDAGYHTTCERRGGLCLREEMR